MKQQVNIKNFQTIIEQLTPESQTYLLNMANMAMVAEKGKEKELNKELVMTGMKVGPEQKKLA